MNMLMKKTLILFGLIIIPFLSFAQNKTIGQVVDIDRNVYNTIIIGTQVWLKENLRVTHYNNGAPIQKVIDTLAWTNLTSSAYCSYNNDDNIALKYGRLYNYYTVVDNRKLCPAGWHVPNDNEWQILNDFLGGNLVAGGKMKVRDTLYWESPNVGATNESEFSALPAGRQYHDSYNFLGEYTNIWSTTQCEYDSNLVWCRYLTFSLPHLCRFTYKKHYGLSVRCLKN